MIKIIDRFKPVENRPDTIILRSLEKDACHLIDDLKIDIKSNSVDLSAKCRFLKGLSNLNKEYRMKVMHINADSKTAALTVNSYNKHNLKDILSDKFCFKFAWAANVAGQDCATTVKYSTDKFWTALTYSVAILSAKYPDASMFQLDLTFYKVLLEYFDINSINFNELQTVSDNFKESQFVYIEDIMKNELDYTETPKKSNSLMPSKEDFEMWIAQGYTQTEIKKSVAEQLGCSEKTVQRILAGYGLTRKYNKN